MRVPIGTICRFLDKDLAPQNVPNGTFSSNRVQTVEQSGRASAADGEVIALCLLCLA